MYLRLINVKAIERQRDSYILVINNRYEKMGESLYRINKDVFKEDIGQLFSNNYQLMNMIRGIQAPDYTSKECSGCEKKYFCSYCIIRGLVAAKEKGFENCAWYSQYIPNEFRRLLI